MQCTGGNSERKVRGRTHRVLRTEVANSDSNCGKYILDSLCDEAKGNQQGEAGKEGKHG